MSPDRKLPRLPLSAVFPPPPGPGVPGDPGVCPPGGPFRRVHAERAVVLGGPAAILLQVAHPLVAEGVAVHSDYTSGPARRLLGTLQAALTVAFGDTAQAHEMARSVGRQHARVRGVTRTGSPGTPAGTPYRANDPHLALWVHATLVWTARRVAHRYAGLELSAAERERHWQESKPFARLFAVPDDVLPGTVAEFDEYFAGTLRRLVVTDAARRVAADVLTQRTAPPLPGIAALVRSVTSDVLPEPLAVAYGTPRTRGRRVVATATRELLRAARPVLPRRIAQWPHAEVARRRLDAGAQVLQPRASTAQV
ncbi:oxygenase MpaB family protein [Kineococcus sp. SYSU DK003]|uniref:oxygenase MpaB family protein n=1 Tax=Kineococcus sp. SYSU DK003 TaxID=3383124 RepID=UPI003D7DEB13